MGRLLRLTPAYSQAYSALKLDAGASSALTKTAVRLERAVSLPGPSDFEVLRWPVGVAWARRVSGTVLWILYEFDEEFVTLREIRKAKPVRVGG